jgi:hypothetical protein
MCNPNQNHDALVADWKANAEDQDDEDYEFVRSQKGKLFGR